MTLRTRVIYVPCVLTDTFRMDIRQLTDTCNCDLILPSVIINNKDLLKQG